MRSLRPFHPLLFALLAVLGPYVPHVNLIRAPTIFPTWLVLTISVIVVWLVLTRITGSRGRSAPIISFLTLIFFSHVFFKLGLRWLVPSLALQSGAIASLITFALMIVASVVYFSGKKDHSDTPLLDTLSVIILVPVLLVWVKYEVTAGLRLDLADPPEGITQLSSQTDSPPDIYYIILDGYARSDILEELYDCDNREFLQQLEELGFYIAHESRSNYTQTGLSLSSSLNFDYLPSLASNWDPESDDRRPLSQLIRNNRIQQLLKGLGYTTVHLSTGYWPVDESKADIVFKAFWPYLGFSRYMYERTPVPSALVWLGIGGINQKGILYNQVDNLAKIEAPSPVFVLAHFMCPHPPFVLGEVKGSPLITGSINDGADMIGEGKLTQEQYVWNYREQVRLFSPAILETIKQILASSKTPKIIIIQGDHGPASLLGARVPTRLSLDERHSILNAYFFPKDRNLNLYPHISPVNSFRLVLNHYFGADLELLEDRSYYSTYYFPYEFKDSSDLETQDVPEVATEK